MGTSIGVRLLSAIIGVIELGRIRNFWPVVSGFVPFLGVRKCFYDTHANTQTSVSFHQIVENPSGSSVCNMM